MAFSPFPAPSRPQAEPRPKPEDAPAPQRAAPADMSVFSMFPQHHEDAEPAQNAAETITPAEAGIRAMIVPIDAPAPLARQRPEPARVGAIGTWQRHEAPIEAPQPPAPMHHMKLAGPTAPPPNFAPISVPPPPEPPAAAPTPAPEPVRSSDIEPPPPPAPSPAPADIEALAEPAPHNAEPSDPEIERLLVAPRVDERLPGPSWLKPAPEPATPELEPDPAPPRTPLLPRIGAWQIATAVSLMIALAAVIVAVAPRAATPLSIAAIGVVNAPAPLYIAEIDSGGKLRLTALATITVPNGRDLQLWIIAPGEQAPTSLGVLPAHGTTLSLPAPPAEGTRFVISMEPRGGAPSGRITGQVLYGGTLANR
eukprot:gene18800-19110_t